jgi:hypothetical protein
VSVTPA